MTRRRVLLIDDHDNVRFGLRRLFEAQGHIVQEADDGLDGVRKARAWRPHVAVVDIDMPLLDGYGVARRIRQALGGGVRLIALTGRDNRERALAAGFDAYLRKPAHPERFHQLLHETAF
ncbi:MAG TPA: response regulator [Gemmataceae bacterium]|jgi:CheY-like chemotaxis protein